MPPSTCCSGRRASRASARDDCSASAASARWIPAPSRCGRPRRRPGSSSRGRRASTPAPFGPWFSATRNAVCGPCAARWVHCSPPQSRPPPTISPARSCWSPCRRARGRAHPWSGRHVRPGRRGRSRLRAEGRQVSGTGCSPWRARSATRPVSTRPAVGQPRRARCAAAEPGCAGLARRLPEAHVVVCDDVLTTGATVREAQRALEAVGLGVARSPRSPQPAAAPAGPQPRRAVCVTPQPECGTRLSSRPPTD